MGNTKKGLRLLFVPALVVFLANAAIMMLELAAFRICARYLGSSLYTWTSVIGVILTGITIGYYIGGFLADKYNPQKTTSLLFLLASVGCVGCIILNYSIIDWLWLWTLSWPVRVFLHVAIVYTLPSVLLGAVNPVLAKWAIDKGLPTGHTVGDIYACGAAGSIFGTFLAGYFLIAALGTVGTVWLTAALLAIIAVLFRLKGVITYVWAGVFVGLFLAGNISGPNAQQIGAQLQLREKENPHLLYEDETQYCYVAVVQRSETPDHRVFMQDKLKHSEIIMDDITHLQYPYEQIHAAITHRYAHNKKMLDVLVIGGGGYVFPRYVAHLWPGSRVDVAEIDPGVTAAAIEGFGLDPNSDIQTIPLDARNYVDGLLENNENTVQYDFIYEDALSDYMIPFQLVTKEFNDKILHLLKEDGIYMIELIEIYTSGLFIGAYINTLEQTFPYVYAISTKDLEKTDRNTFVLAASKIPLDLTDLETYYTQSPLNLWYLNQQEIELLKEKASHMVLTDDYAPVENLMAPVVKQSARDLLIGRYYNKAKQLREMQQFEESLKIYRKILKLDPNEAIAAYNHMASIYTEQNRLPQVAESFENMIKAAKRSPGKNDLSGIYFNLGVLYKQLGQSEKAVKSFQTAKEALQEILGAKPNYLKAQVLLGDTYAELGDFQQASDAFRSALMLRPFDPGIQLKYINALEYQGKLQDSRKAAQEAMQKMEQSGQTENAEYFRHYLNKLNAQ